MTEKARGTLDQARTQLVKLRRDYAQGLSKVYERGTTDSAMQGFVNVQVTIEALDRAFKDEEILGD
jgi:hypothetical protein